MKLDIKRTIKEHTAAQQIIELLLKDRGLDKNSDFFSPPNPVDIDFETFFDKKKYQQSLASTIALLTDIKESEKTIVVYCDYDADGITGGAVLWETLHLLGFKVMPHVPNRRTEGYGFSKVGIDLVKEKYNPALIISVDHGIMGHEQITYAKTLGISIIITDHHSKAETDPKDAIAIFHTDKLSGSGVAYFFAKTIFEKLPPSTTNNKQLTTNFSNDYLALASIGTIADLVPLVGPSRSIVKYGLSALSKSKRPGLKHLFIDSQIAGRDMTPYEVGFIIAPRINAFGRLTHAIDALRLLCTVHDEKAKELAKRAGDVNRDRQGLVEVGVEQAFKMVQEKDKIIIVSSPDWNEGIIGLIASKLVEKYYRPSIVLSVSDGYAKASARSISGFNITEFLRAYKEYLMSVGGHAAAAGFSVKHDMLEKLVKALRKSAQDQITDEQLIPTTKVDVEIPFESNSLELARLLESLAPFGVGNPYPTFSINAKIIDIKLIGKNSDHLKLMVKGENGLPIEALFFGQGAMSKELNIGDERQLVYKLEIDRWNGREKLKMMGKVIL